MITPAAVSQGLRLETRFPRPTLSHVYQGILAPVQESEVLKDMIREAPRSAAVVPLDQAPEPEGDADELARESNLAQAPDVLKLRFRGPGRRSLGARSQKVSTKSRKSLLGPGPQKSEERLKKVSKKVRKVKKKSENGFLETFRTSFETFFRLSGPRARETFSRLFRDFFETFWLRAPRLLLPGPRDLNIKGHYARRGHQRSRQERGGQCCHLFGEKRARRLGRLSPNMQRAQDDGVCDKERCGREGLSGSVQTAERPGSHPQRCCESTARDAEPQ